MPPRAGVKGLPLEQFTYYLSCIRKSVFKIIVLKMESNCSFAKSQHLQSVDDAKIHCRSKYQREKQHKNCYLLKWSYNYFADDSTSVLFISLWIDVYLKNCSYKFLSPNSVYKINTCMHIELLRHWPKRVSFPFFKSYSEFSSKGPRPWDDNSEAATANERQKTITTPS